MFNKLVSLITVPLACLSLSALAADYTPPEEGDTGFYKGKDTRADAAYFSPDNAEGARNFRSIYIKPVNLSGMRIIQPEGGATDSEWTLSDVEDGAIQNAARSELASTLSHGAAFNIVDDAESADMILHTTLVAIHPYATREEVEAGERRGGALTVSLALANAKTGKVMVRAVDTKSTDNIWAFHQVDNEDPAVALIFRSWGNSIRRGILHLQGRSNDPLAQPILVKPQ